MARQVLDLSTFPWQFGRVPRQPWGPAPADDRAAVAEWLPASVPGDVRADLIAAGRIPPVETLEGIAAGRWIDDYDWWYQVVLPDGPADGAAADVMLEADGIDYYSAIWLDRDCLATHAGMFARQTVPLSPHINRPGPHSLAIRIWGSGALLANSPRRRALRSLFNRLMPDMDHFSERMATTKAQFSFGWDFAPRLLSAGIWDGIRLVTARGAYIEDLWAYGEPLAPEGDPAPVAWHLRLRLARSDPRPLLAEVTVAPDNFDGSGYQTLYHTLEVCSEQATPCVDDYEFLLEMPVARRWWPWDQGEPCLYRVTVRLRDEQGLVDEISLLTGARSLRRAELPGGAPWRFVVNERPVFLRGANWVPVDVLPGRVRAEDYARLIGQARAAGVNFLRVWGGGLREKAAFWETCDRLGMVAWQEFPLACDFFDRYTPQPAYLGTLAAEAEGTLRALRSHPSLIAWCGGNEIDTEREAGPLSLLAALCRQHDPTRPWIPASPSDGDLHQWNTWHGLAHWSELAEIDVPFMSEFGFQALPDPATLDEMFAGNPPASWRDRRWGRRKAQVNKLRHYAGERSLAPARAAEATQRVQAAGLQAGVEACRLRRDTCGGVAIWQLNEPWPAVSWAIIDHAGRPKAAYQRLACIFQPVLAAARFPWRRYAAGETFRAELWLVNDSPVAWAGCRLVAEIDGAVTWQQDGLELPPASSRRAGDLACVLARPPQSLALRLLAPGADGQDRTLASNIYDLAIPFPRPRPLPARLNRWLARRLTKTG